MSIDLYYHPGSSPSRAVLLTFKALGLSFNPKVIDLMKREHLTPEFVKLNPAHAIPTIVDNGLVLSESRAIITYLVGQYGKDDSLYPKDLKKRAIVDHRLYFDATTLYARFDNYTFTVAFEGASWNPLKLKQLKEALEMFDTYLGSGNFAAGHLLTVADLSLVTTVSSIEVLKDVDIKEYKNISRWYANIQKVAPGYKEANADGFLLFKELIDQLTAGK